MSVTFEEILSRIQEMRGSVPRVRSVLVAVSGIDGSGKGYITKRLVGELEKAGLKTVGINVDGWLNLPAKRFGEANPAEHFYLNALRFDELFEQLIVPLRDKRSVRVEADFADETATEFRRQLWEFDDVDVIVLEGIYLLKRELLAHYDLSVWIDCSFETALERAIGRAQEGLAPEATTEAYHRIYFPAQEIHFQRDEPRKTAHLVFVNDSRLEG